ARPSSCCSTATSPVCTGPAPTDLEADRPGSVGGDDPGGELGRRGNLGVGLPTCFELCRGAPEILVERPKEAEVVAHALLRGLGVTVLDRRGDPLVIVVDRLMEATACRGPLQIRLQDHEDRLRGG